MHHNLRKKGQILCQHVSEAGNILHINTYSDTIVKSTLLFGLGKRSPPPPTMRALFSLYSAGVRWKIKQGQWRRRVLYLPFFYYWLKKSCALSLMLLFDAILVVDSCLKDKKK